MTSEDRTSAAQNDKVGAKVLQSILIFGNSDRGYARRCSRARTLGRAEVAPVV